MECKRDQDFRLTTKGDKPHEVPIHPILITALDDHLGKMKEMGFDTSDSGHILFPSMRTKLNRPMTTVGIKSHFHGHRQAYDKCKKSHE